MSHGHSHGKWSIEIDGLPWFTKKKWVDFPWQTVSHNQRVFQRYFRNTSCWMIIWYYLPKCCGAKPKKTNDWGVGRGPCGMVLNPWHGFLAVPCSLSPWCLDFHFHDVWPLLFYPLLNIIFHFLCFFPNDSTQAVQAQRIMSTLEDGQGAPPSCPDFFS